MADIKTQKHDAIVLSSQSEKDLQLRFVEMLKRAPLPDDELLPNLGLFLSSKSLSRILFFYEIYQKILGTHGVVMEFGVRWGQTLSLLAALVSGACLYSSPTFDAGEALRVMSAEKCTLTSGNDTMFLMLLNHPDFESSPLTLRGGWASCGVEVTQKIIDRMGVRGVCQAYGLSEAAPNVCIQNSVRREPCPNHCTNTQAQRTTISVVMTCSFPSRFSNYRLK